MGRQYNGKEGAVLKTENNLKKLQSATDDEKRKILKKLYMQDLPRLIHPDQNPESREAATNIFQKYREGMEEMKEKLGENAPISGHKPMLLSDDSYQKIIQLVDAYEKEVHWWFVPSFLNSKTKLWKKLRKKASDFANGVSEKDFADINEALKYKERGEEVPHSLQMSYLKRKNQQYYDLINAEKDIIDHYLHPIAQKGSKVYKSERWIELQRFLENRQEEFTRIGDYVFDSSVPTGQEVELTDNRLRMREVQMNNIKRNGIYSVIGGFVILAVLAWLKEMMTAPRKQNTAGKQISANIDIDDDYVLGSNYRNWKDDSNDNYNDDFDSRQVNRHRRIL